MNIMIIGANGLLARSFIREVDDYSSTFHLTATNKDSLKNITSDSVFNYYTIDFNDTGSIKDFFNNHFDEDYTNRKN